MAPSAPSDQFLGVSEGVKKSIRLPTLEELLLRVGVSGTVPGYFYIKFNYILILQTTIYI